jgi:hypothetical protein
MEKIVTQAAKFKLYLTLVQQQVGGQGYPLSCATRSAMSGQGSAARMDPISTDLSARCSTWSPRELVS